MMVERRNFGFWLALLLIAQLAFAGCGGCDETGAGTTNNASSDCVDEDEDGFGVGDGCTEPVDCDDSSSASYPGADEFCGDELDNNCDGQIDEDCESCTDGQTRQCGSDAGACETGTQTCTDGEWGACDGEVRPQPEVCDGVDNDCDGDVDEDPEQSLCDDGVKCNGVEVCDAGACVDSEPVDCTHLDEPCFEGVCLEKDGSCVQQMVSDGTTCEDDNFCTVDGVCQQGVCETDSRDCSAAGDQCNEGICDEDTDSCVPQPVSDGTTCDDGTFCTVADSCQQGVCEGSTRDCSGAGDQCNEGICDEDADSCVAQPIADGTSCDDGAYCTVNDTCQAGACQAGGTRQCGAAGGSCRTGVCNEATDSCDGAPVPDGTACNDGLFCTTNDACQAGTCVAPAAMDCSAAGDQCNDGVCNESRNRCEPQPVADGTTCDDGTFCTVSDACTAGTCGGSARDCTGAGDQCNTGVCDESAGACVPSPRSDGTTCDDGSFCTVNDSCTSGACGGGSRNCASAGDQCNDGVCDDDADACVPSPVADGTTCDDGEFCTSADACTAGSCGGSQTDCSTFTDQCNVGMCDEGADDCYAAPVSDGTTCDDSDPCTVSDQCGSGSCGGSPKDCSALTDQCNVGVCDPVTGDCVAEPVVDGTSCNDGQFCTTNDTCQAGSCTGGAPLDCSSAGDQCNDGVCDEGADACVADPVADDTTCDDGEFCTVSDSCQAGTCNGGGARDCSASTDQCNTGICDEGADSCVADPVANGTSCNDGQFCTVTDACQSGTCTGATRDCSGVADQCNAGACDEGADTCFKDPVADGTACTDGQYCTVSDECFAGSCLGSTRDCSAVADQCNAGACDETTNTCYADPVADGTACDDGAWCTVSDACTGGACAGATRDCSAAAGGEACALGVCDDTFDQCEKEYDPTCCDTTVDNDLDGSNQCDDCDDTNGGVYPGATEVCNGIDDDCDGLIDEDYDADGDGYATCTSDPALKDCDDTDANINPGMNELCGASGTGNGVDDDCDGYVDEGCNPCTTTDADGDGFSECDGDCDDSDDTMYPGNTEVCDGKDNDCNAFTTKNCDVSEPCNFGSGTDVCMDDRICACIVDPSGGCSGYQCTPFCNWSETGPVGDGCGTDQTCMYDLFYSANIHGCGIASSTPGTKGGGETCSDDSDCRSLSCGKLCRGPGCNQEYCRDYCGSDDYCGTGAVCRLQDSGSDVDGRCWPAGGPLLGSSSVGTACSSDTSCDHGLCMTDPNDSSEYCTEACCTDSDCPSGFSCSAGGTAYDARNTSGQLIVYSPPTASSCTTDADCTGEGGECLSGQCAWQLQETSPMCVRDVAGQGSRQAGQACTQNSDCESNFCERDLGVCVSPCCNDSACPTGLSCEKQYVQNGTDRATQMRVCVNLSTENVLQYK